MEVSGRLFMAPGFHLLGFIHLYGLICNYFAWGGMQFFTLLPHFCFWFELIQPLSDYNIIYTKFEYGGGRLMKIGMTG